VLLNVFIEAHLTDGCGGAGPVWRFAIIIIIIIIKTIIIKITTDFIFMTVFPEIF
jgi:hypothetical protein